MPPSATRRPSTRPNSPCGWVDQRVGAPGAAGFGRARHQRPAWSCGAPRRTVTPSGRPQRGTDGAARLTRPAPPPRGRGADNRCRCAWGCFGPAPAGTGAGPLPGGPTARVGPPPAGGRDAGSARQARGRRSRPAPLRGLPLRIGLQRALPDPPCRVGDRDVPPLRPGRVGTGLVTGRAARPRSIVPAGPVASGRPPLRRCPAERRRARACRRERGRIHGPLDRWPRDTTARRSGRTRRIHPRTGPTPRCRRCRSRPAAALPLSAHETISYTVHGRA